MLQKGLGRVPHEGGQRFAADEHPRPDASATGWPRACRTIRPAPATVKSIEVLPGSRVLNDPGRWQQLAVLATSATAACAT